MHKCTIFEVAEEGKVAIIALLWIRKPYVVQLTCAYIGTTGLTPERVNTLFLTVQKGLDLMQTYFKEIKLYIPGKSEIFFKVQTNAWC